MSETIGAIGMTEAEVDRIFFESVECLDPDELGYADQGFDTVLKTRGQVIALRALSSRPGREGSQHFSYEGVVHGSETISPTGTKVKFFADFDRPAGEFVDAASLAAVDIAERYNRYLEELGVEQDV